MCGLRPHIKYDVHHIHPTVGHIIMRVRTRLQRKLSLADHAMQLPCAIIRRNQQNSTQDTIWHMVDGPNRSQAPLGQMGWPLDGSQAQLGQTGGVPFSPVQGTRTRYQDRGELYTSAQI